MTTCNNFSIYSIFLSFVHFTSTENILDGLPSLKKESAFTRTHSTNTHGIATSKALEFYPQISFTELQPPTQSLLWFHAGRQPFHAANEVELVVYVKLMVSEIIEAIPALRDIKITIRQELKEADGCRPDVLVLLANENPFFIIAVKKLGIFEVGREAALGKIHGQMYDYLLSLHRNHGLANPYGMICTYEQTQICWLEDAEKQKDEKTRELNVSGKIYDISNLEYKSTIVAIAGALTKGFSSKQKPPSERILSGYFSVFRPEFRDWEKLPVRNAAGESLQFRPKLPSADKAAMGLFLLQFFHGGAEGKTYLVCSSDREQCVIKHFFLVTRRDSQMKSSHGSVSIISSRINCVSTANPPW